jgi:hypothetical protein
VTRDDLVRERCRELDPHHRLEVGPPLVPPPDPQPLPGEPLGAPEPLHLLRVVVGQRAAEPGPERAPGGVVVDHEGGAPAPHHPLQFAQPGLAPGAEEVRPPGVRHID